MDLTGVAVMLARGELSLGEPWLLVWRNGEADDDEDGALPAAAPAALPGSGPVSGDGDGDGKGGGGGGGGRKRPKLG